MIRDLSALAVIAAAVLAAAALSAPSVRADEMAPSYQSRLVNADFTDNAAAPMPEANVGALHVQSASLHVQGGPAAVQLDVRQTRITGVLAALAAAYKISYSSSIALDEMRDGTYTGSLGHVISRVLDGYSYVIKHDNADLDVIIFEKSGEQAVPNPTLASVRQHRIPTTNRISRH